MTLRPFSYRRVSTVMLSWALLSAIPLTMGAFLLVADGAPATPLPWLGLRAVAASGTQGELLATVGLVMMLLLPVVRNISVFAESWKHRPIERFLSAVGFVVVGAVVAVFLLTSSPSVNTAHNDVEGVSLTGGGPDDGGANERR